jgi:ribose 5-phosphate isomerase B
MRTIHLSTDHAGLGQKESIKTYLKENSYQVIDYSPSEYVPDDDYPDFIIPAVEAAVAGGDLAIVLGGSGQGEAIAANKVFGARAVVYYGGSKQILRLSREHNNANVLSLGARFLTENEVVIAVKMWLGSKFSADERHIRRLEKISNYENSKTE